MTGCEAVHTRPTGERVVCLTHEGPWHVGLSSIGRFTWPRTTVRAFPYRPTPRAPHVA